MNCEQKSGVLLNMSCQNHSENTCIVCAKKICALHTYEYEDSLFCDSCFWIQYLGETDKEEDVFQVIIETRRGYFSTENGNPYRSNESNQYNQSNSQRDEFEFGGGSFGGGGASGKWDDDDLDSFDIKEGVGPDSRDDSFFYS